MNYAAFYEALSDDSTKETVIQLLFNIPVKLRKYIQNSFATAAAAQPEQFCEVIIAILDLINENMSLIDVQTILLLTLDFINESSNIQPVAETLHEILGPLISAAGEAVTTDTCAYTIIGASASIMAALLAKDLIPIDDLVTDAIDIFIEGCGVESSDRNVSEMKERILDFFVFIVKKVYEGNVPDFEDESDQVTQQDEEDTDEDVQIKAEKAELVQLFNENITSRILEGALSITKVPQTQNMLSSLITLLYEMVLYNICPEDIVTEEFFANFIIPCARMTSSDFADYHSNPNVFIETAFTDDNDQCITARTAASRFTRIAVKRYIAHYDPLELIAQIGDDKVETEARVFLMCAYASSMLFDPDLFEAVFNLLTTEIPPPLVSTILRLVSIVQPKDDPATSSAVASHFILNSVDPIIGHAAVLLLSECLNSLDDRVEDLNGILETPYEELFGKIEELSNVLCLSLEADVMAKLFRVGGTEIVSAAEALVQHMFTLWDEAVQAQKDETDEIKYIDSIRSIIDSIDPQTQAIEGLQSALFQELQERITNFPHNASVPNMITVAAYIALKLQGVSQELLAFIEFIMQHMAEGESGIDFTDSIVLLIGGTLLKPENPLFGDSDFIQALGTLIHGVLVQKEEEENERSSEETANALILAALVVKLGCTDFLQFVGEALNILGSMTQKEMFDEECIALTWSSFYLFASAFIVAPEQTMEFFTPEAAQMVIERFTQNIADLAHRDLKMGFITLSFLAKYNVPNAFDRAGDIAQRLLDADEYEDIRKEKNLQIHQVQEFYDEQQLTAFVPALMFPIDDFNEFEFYQEIHESMPL